MPYDDPEVDDPQELVGVELPGDETVTCEMAAAFADEFAQLGFTRPQILGLFRRAEYTGAYQAWTLLGEASNRAARRREPRGLGPISAVSSPTAWRTTRRRSRCDYSGRGAES